MELIKLVKSEKPRLRILILSMHQELQYAVRAIKSGASGYLPKESAPAQLEQAIRKIAAGGAYISAEVAEQLALGAMPNAGAAAPHETPRSALEGLKVLDLGIILSIPSCGRTLSELGADVRTVVEHVRHGHRRHAGQLGDVRHGHHLCYSSSLLGHSCPACHAGNSHCITV